MKRAVVILLVAALSSLTACASGEPQKIRCRDFVDLSDGERVRVLQTSSGLRTQVTENAVEIGGQDRAWALLISSYAAACRRDGYEDKLVFSLTGTDLRARPTATPSPTSSATRTSTTTSTITRTATSATP